MSLRVFQFTKELSVIKSGVPDRTFVSCADCSKPVRVLVTKTSKTVCHPCRRVRNSVRESARPERKAPTRGGRGPCRGGCGKVVQAWRPGEAAMCRDCRRVQPREEKCKTCGSICPRGAGYYVRTTCSPECRTRTAGPCSECGE